MAVLGEADRVLVWADLVRRAESYDLYKSDIRAAVDATDNWIETNKASFNAALPANVQSALTMRQKALLFMAVAVRKFEVE